MTDVEIEKYVLPKQKLFERYKGVYEALSIDKFATIVGMPQSGRSAFFHASKEQNVDVFKDVFEFDNYNFISINAVYKNTTSSQYREYIINALIQHLPESKTEEILGYIRAHKMETAMSRALAELQKESKKHDITNVLIFWGLDSLIEFNPEHISIIKELMPNYTADNYQPLKMLFVLTPATLYSEHTSLIRMYLRENVIIQRVLDDEEMDYTGKRQEVLHGYSKESQHSMYKELSAGHYILYLRLYSSMFSDKELRDLSYLRSSGELRMEIGRLADAIDLDSPSQVAMVKEMGILDEDGNFKSPLLRGKRDINVAYRKATPQQLEILNYLASREDEVISRDELAKHIWGDLWSVKYSDWALDKQISTIRSHLKGSGYTVQAVRGKGLKYVAERS